MIWEELDERLIVCNMEACDADDVFEKLGQGFIELGKCKSSYILALKEREKEFPTGLQLTEWGVAIPHTNTEHVLHHAIGIAILKKPVEFVQMGSINEIVQVKIVFMLAIKDAQRHVEQLSRLVGLMQGAEFVLKLVKAGNVQEIIDIIKEADEAFIE